MVFVAEIGDVTRFSRPQQLCSWAGMTPKHHESDTKVHRGRITKQGNTLMRWAAVEAVKRVRSRPIETAQARIAERCGGNIATVAAARKLLSSITACATGTSVAWPRRRQPDSRSGPARSWRRQATEVARL